MPLSLINPGENPQDASRSGQFSDAKTTACGWDDDATLGIMDGVLIIGRGCKAKFSVLLGFGLIMLL